MKRASFADKLVVVTGASSGMGREISRALAYQEGAHLVIAARRRERLEALKQEIESSCASRVYVCVVDLSSQEGPETLFRAAESVGQVFGLVNCAGVTYYGKTLDGTTEAYESMVALNFLGPMKVTMLFLREFLARGAGAILTVTSFDAFVPSPFQNLYGATKHALQAFIEGCAVEYRGSGMVFSTIAPGGMTTEMITLSGLDKKFAATNPVNMAPARAAAIALRGWKRGTAVIVPGLLYKTARFFIRFVPRSVVARFMHRLYAP
jgi:short-subunit dehydrogenase